jgi:hypothetical protein
MNPDDPKPLTPATLALLRAEKGALFAPEEARSRVLERLTSVLPGPGALGAPRGPGGHGPNGGSAGSAPPHQTLTLLARPLSLGLAVAVGAVGGAVTWNALRPIPKPKIVYVDREVLAPPPAVMPSTAVPPSLPSAPVTSREPVRAAVEPQTSAIPDGQLAAERGLLDVARMGLARGNGEDALAAASKHEERYPSGALAEEREAMAIQALILLKRYDRARVRGARFHQRFPGSVLAPAVEAALAGIP